MPSLLINREINRYNSTSIKITFHIYLIGIKQKIIQQKN